MRVLGIETSCDETAMCLIEAGGAFGPDFRFKILGNALSSQAALHTTYGGVFPNVAKREHAKALVPLLQKCLQQVGEKVPQQLSTPLDDDMIYHISAIVEREPELLAQLEPFLRTQSKPHIDAIAVTVGPGLGPCLWVGVNFARALSATWDVPIVAVNHLEGHVVMSMMDVRDPSSGKLAECRFPVIALLISGGHTELVLSKEFGTYELLGQTRDDAVGEAFDKVARLLGLPYPGGPEISRLSREARRSDEVTPHRIRLPRPMLHENNLDFSFSGLKTAVRRLVERRTPTDEEKKKIAREFEDAVADVLVEKTLRAVDTCSTNTLVVGGGVSANAEIRRRISIACQLSAVNCQLLIPPPEFATDNAIMIALAGYFRALKKEFADPTTIQACGNLPLA